MTVQDIDISHAIWGKIIVDLKGKINKKKNIYVAGDIVKIPKELVKLHKEIFMTADILLVNGMPFLVF